MVVTATIVSFYYKTTLLLTSVFEERNVSVRARFLANARCQGGTICVGLAGGLNYSVLYQLVISHEGVSTVTSLEVRAWVTGHHILLRELNLECRV